MYNVLLVDDEPWILEGLELLIDWEAHHFRIQGKASNGIEALELLSSIPVHVVITDIRMPLMEGIELTRCIRERYPHIHVIILSGFNDFSYAKSAIHYQVFQYLLKPVDRDELIEALGELRAKLNDQMRVLLEQRDQINTVRDKRWLELAMGYLTPGQMEELAHDSQLKQGAAITAYQQAIVEIVEFRQLLNTNIHDAKLLKYAVRNIAEEMLEKSGRGIVYDELHGRLGLLLLHREGQEDAQPLLQQLLENGRMYLKLALRIGAGLPAESLEDANRSYRQACHAVDSLPEAGGCVQYAPHADVAMGTEDWDFEPLLAAIEEGKEADIIAQASAFEQWLSAYDLPSTAVQGLLYGHIAAFRRLYRLYCRDDMEASLLRIEQLLLPEAAAPVPLSIRQRLLHASMAVYHDLHERQDQQIPSLVKQVCEYIEEHFDQELTLKQLGAHFYVNSAYLGQLFKRAIGDSFNDYVNKIRIRHIKDRARDGEARIYDIIQNAGFKNTEYFYRQFKRYEGISFAEYQEQRRGPRRK